MPNSDRSTQKIAVFGSTGSIGKATLEVIQSLGAPYQIHSIAAHRSLDLLDSQIELYSPSLAVATDTDSANRAGWAVRSHSSRKRVGAEHLEQIARDPEVDTLVAAIVGSAGLLSCLAAAEAGKRLALANKEALVVAGPLLTEAIRKGGGELLPIDSEHSAIFQAMRSGSELKEVKRIILTASGGSLRDWPKEKLSSAKAADALDHPTWQMGKKITIDSATMMNKALEIIEARWLFQVNAEQIHVVIHPQSIIHSMVEFVDGSVVAQLSPPDMRLPIQYALTYPNRLPCLSTAMDWTQALSLEWSPADMERYPALELGFEVAARGGTCGSVLNAANESAVQLFLEGQIAFPAIVQACRTVLDHHNYHSHPSLDELMQLDRWARKEIYTWAKIKC